MQRIVVVAALTMAAGLAVPAPIASGAPGNDDFAGALPVTLGAPVVVDTTTAAHGAGDPDPSCWEFPTESHSVWFSFTAGATGGVVADTAGTAFGSPDDDTVLAVFAGPAPGALAELACNDDFGGEYEAQVGWPVVAGETYYLLAGGWDHAEVGELRLELEAAPMVTGVTTLASGGVAGGAAVDLFDAAGYLLRRVETTAAGDFTLVARAGEYRLRFGGAGGYGTVWFDGAGGFGSATPVTLGPGGLSGIGAALVASSLGGHVRDAVTAAPLAGIAVTVVDLAGTVVGAAATGADGGYTVGHLQPGAYRVGFVDPAGAYLPQWHPGAATLAGAAPVDVGSGPPPTIDAALRLPSGITGTVTGDAGQPLAGIEVRATAAGGAVWGPWLTDAAGGYSADGLAPGAYRVEFADPAGAWAPEWYEDAPDAGSASPVTVAAGGVVAGIDAALTPAAPIDAAITGTVTSAAGVPLAGIDVAGGGAVATTDAGGAYRLDVPAGSHVVSFTDPAGGWLAEWFDDAPDAGSASPVAVAAGATAGGVDAVLALDAAVAAAITGTVTGDAGEPLAGIVVAGGGAAAATDAGGAYRLDVPAGSHVVSFTDPAGGWLAEWFDDAPDAGSASPVVVAAGATVGGVDAELARDPAAAGAITGTVTGAAGVPLAGIVVAADAVATVTDAAGVYRLDVAAGSHLVQFTDPTGAHAGEWYDDRPDAASAVPVVVAANATIDGIDAALAAVNRPPVAVDDAGTVERGGLLAGPTVLANDHDPDGDALVAELVDGPSHGFVVISPAGRYWYWHDGGSEPADAFTYRAGDGELWSAPATVRITVSGSGTGDPGGGDPGGGDPGGGDPGGGDPGTGDPGGGDPASGSGDAAVLGALLNRGGDLGLVDPAQGRWHLHSKEGATATFFYGNPGDHPMMGDWDCDGVDTPGLYRRSDGYVYLRNSNSQGIADVRFFFGNPGDLPLAGDFDGDGCDTVSIYRPAEARTYVINALGADEGGLGAAEHDYLFGNPGDKPFVGDFDGDGLETVGLHRESTGLVYFRNSTTTGIADSQFIYGDPGDRLVASDWNGDGADSPAVFRPATATFYLRHHNTQGVADETLAMGEPGWLPVAGWFGL